MIGDCFFMHLEVFLTHLQNFKIF